LGARRQNPPSLPPRAADGGRDMEEGDKSFDLENLRRDYQDTVKELSGSKATVVQGFTTEYEKLYMALKKSIESENRLIKKIKDLTAEIGASAQSVQTAMKTAAEDQQQIQTLRSDIEAHQKMVQQSLEKERVAKEAIAKLKDEIAEVVSRIEQDAGMSTEQQNLVNQLETQKEQCEEDRRLLKDNVEKLQVVCEHKLQEVHKALEGRTGSEDAIANMKQMVADKQTEIETEKKRKEELEQQMKDMRVANETQQEEFINIQRQIKSEEADLKKIEQDIEEADKDLERLKKRAEMKIGEKSKLQEKLEHEVQKNQKYVMENEQRELTLRKTRTEIESHSAERKRVSDLKAALEKKERALEEERKEIENKRNAFKQDIKESQEKSDALKKDSDVDRKKIEDLVREREILNKNVIKADERTKKQIDLVKRQETQALNAQKDISRWKQDAHEFKKRIYELEKQCEKYGIEWSAANAEWYKAQEELKMRTAKITDLKKKISTVQAKRNQQKGLYESVVMESNVHRKNKEDKTNEIEEMHREFKTRSNDIRTLKEQIWYQERDVVKGHFKYNEAEDVNTKLRESNEKASRKMKSLLKWVENQRIQMKKLEATIQEAEKERQDQQKELEGVIGERDILGAQLIRRNEELALLYEKIKIQQSTLQKGEIQYAERVQEVERLKHEIRKTKLEVIAAKNQVVNVDTLKREIHYKSKVLLREQAKAKALQVELDNPMNVHRWRQLAGSDPGTFEMIKKVKKLQTQLIAKTEEVAEKEIQIREKESLYVQLKSHIAKQPGPEVAEQLSWYSQNLKEKTAHMKKMAAELEEYHTQVHSLKDEIDMHSRDFSTVKQAYFQKLREQRRQMAIHQQQQQQAAATML